MPQKFLRNHRKLKATNTKTSWFSGNAPAEYAIVSYAERTIQPLLASHPWFAAGDFGVDCEFKDDGKIGLLIHYCPSRYDKSDSAETALTETN